LILLAVNQLPQSERLEPQAQAVDLLELREQRAMQAQQALEAPGQLELLVAMVLQERLACKEMLARHLGHCQLQYMIMERLITLERQ
jgi:hypothetical protein